MSWYYAIGSQSIGPFTPEQMKELIRQGTISPETLVWREGQSGWLPVRVAVGKSGEAATPAAAAPPPAQPPVSVATAPAPAGAASKPPKKCDVCNKKTPPGDLIREGEFWICGPCRMEAYRRKYGTLPRYSVPQYYAAGFWIRLLARFLDGLVLGVVQGIITVLLGLKNPFTGFQANPDTAGLTNAYLSFMQSSMFLIQLGAGLFYEMFFLGMFGATPGKLALGLKVVSEEGQPIGVFRAFCRYFAMQLSGCFCAFGYLMAAFTENKRALHDMLCGTRVVHR